MMAMQIIVCLKEVVDPALNIDFGLTNRIVFQKGLPLKLNPNDAAALSLALDIKNKTKDVEITLVSIGQDRLESYLRNGLACGVDRGVRIWEEGIEGLSPYLKGRLLTQAVNFFGADLVFTGSRSLDTANGQVGSLMAGWLDWPCVSEVVTADFNAEQNNITLIKALGRGEREKIACPLPAVVTIRGEGRLPYASLDRLIESKYSEIILYSPADLGINESLLKLDPARVTGLVFPRPVPCKVPPLDSSLPAFDRILQLLAGGIAKRKGVIFEGSGEELSEQLFQLLKDEGVLKSAIDS
jgi:electron transfer flavoprotein beta subunit